MQTDLLTKLALRNAGRSMKDYLVYFITMAMISAMMFAFNSLIFSKDIQSMCSEASMLAAMLGMITFFIILLVAWLINYMARFMLQKRSREFAAYLLAGLKKKQVSRLYMKENLLVGLAGLGAGLVLGVFLQQFLMTLFYSVFDQAYPIHVQINFWCLLMTAGCYLGCYLLALWRNRRSFRKMTIAGLLQMEKENESTRKRHDALTQWLFFAAVFYILFVYYIMVRGCSVTTALLLIAGFIMAVYLLYAGLGAFLMRFTAKHRGSIYKGERLFLLRQLAGKIRTMRFTTGTLTLLLICALLGSSYSLMFARYLPMAISSSMPFDILIHSPNTEDNFSEELSVISGETTIRRQCIYRIYEDHSTAMNQYFCSHVYTVSDGYLQADGTYYKEPAPDGGEDSGEYYAYDTFLKLSDYNALRALVGEPALSLASGTYALQTKERILPELGEDIYRLSLTIDGKTFSCSEISTIPFSQNGINGADYLIILPDEAMTHMTPYYSAAAMDIEGEGTQALSAALHQVHAHKLGLVTADEYTALEENDSLEEEISEEKYPAAYGTDEMLVLISDILVRDSDTREAKFATTSLIFPLAYISLIFLFIALTVLAVQQISDSGKYRFRYDILRKLGMKEKQLDCLVLKQLSLYYLIPALAAIAISSVIAVYCGTIFNRFTGAADSGWYYFGISLLLLLVVYMIYFFATYLSFKRNIRPR